MGGARAFEGRSDVSVVTATDLEKTYRVGMVDVPALRGVTFDIGSGAFVAFVGPSGSGRGSRS
jgi:putative ABC transport system ATP-binding protein